MYTYPVGSFPEENTEKYSVWYQGVKGCCNKYLKMNAANISGIFPLDSSSISSPAPYLHLLLVTNQKNIFRYGEMLLGAQNHPGLRTSL